MSITSMSARAGMAQKLSIPQLQQAIQDGVIPAYVGVPLLQDKVKQQKEAMAVAAQSKMPSVAEQVMMEATQAERGVPALETNLPTTGMAGGGIVAFADGGLYDDEDTDEDRIDTAREADLDAAMQEAMDARETLGLMPAPKGSEDSYHAVRVNPKGGEFEAIAMEKNKQHGVDEHLLKHVMHKETGGLKDRAHAVSSAGAQGVMQLMPATAKSLGVKDAFDPEQNIEGGVKYLAQLERKYKDPKLAAMAYNWGPGNVDKWLMAGADMSKLPKETRGYVQGLAQGGEVKHFAKGDLVFDPITGEPVYEGETPEGLGDKFLRAINYKKGLTAGDTMSGMAKAKEQVAAALAARNAPVVPPKPEVKPQPEPQTKVSAENAYTRGQDATDALVGNVSPETNIPSPVAAEAAAKPDQFAEFKDLFAKREANLAKQKEQDKYMAMLQAGLGMMGGTSRYALTNIGAGAQQGIQSLAQARAANAAEENALLSGRLGLAKIGATQEQALAAQQLRKDIFNAQNARLTEAGKEQAAARTERLTQSASKELQDSLENRYNILSKNALKQAEGIYNPKEKQAFLDDLEKRINQDKIYRELHKQRWGYYPDADVGGAAQTSGNSSLFSKADAILNGK